MPTILSTIQSIMERIAVHEQWIVAHEQQKAADKRQLTLTMEAALGNVVGTDPTMFNADRIASTKASDIPQWRGVAKTLCEVCGSRASLSRAHIIAREEDAKQFNVDYFGTNNFLCLCGNRDMPTHKGGPDDGRQTCHFMFSRKIMSFLHVLDDTTGTQFVAVGGPHHGQVVTFARKPHKRVLLSHFLHCMKNTSLQTREGEVVTSIAMLGKPALTADHIQQWVAATTLPQELNQTGTEHSPPVSARSWQHCQEQPHTC